MNILLIIGGAIAVIVLVGLVFRPVGLGPVHIVDEDADGEPDVTETERREALRQAEDET